MQCPGLGDAPLTGEKKKCFIRELLEKTGGCDAGDLEGMAERALRDTDPSCYLKLRLEGWDLVPAWALTPANSGGGYSLLGLDDIDVRYGDCKQAGERAGIRYCLCREGGGSRSDECGDPGAITVELVNIESLVNSLVQRLQPPHLIEQVVKKMVEGKTDDAYRELLVHRGEIGNTGWATIALVLAAAGIPAPILAGNQGDEARFTLLSYSLAATHYYHGRKRPSEIAVEALGNLSSRRRATGITITSLSDEELKKKLAEYAVEHLVRIAERGPYNTMLRSPPEWLKDALKNRLQGLGRDRLKELLETENPDEYINKLTECAKEGDMAALGALVALWAAGLVEYNPPSNTPNCSNSPGNPASHIVYLAACRYFTEPSSTRDPRLEAVIALCPEVGKHISSCSPPDDLGRNYNYNAFRERICDRSEWGGPRDLEDLLQCNNGGSYGDISPDGVVQELKRLYSKSHSPSWQAAYTAAHRLIACLRNQGCRESLWRELLRLSNDRLRDSIVDAVIRALEDSVKGGASLSPLRSIP